MTPFIGTLVSKYSLTGNLQKTLLSQFEGNHWLLRAEECRSVSYCPGAAPYSCELHKKYKGLFPFPHSSGDVWEQVSTLCRILPDAHVMWAQQGHAEI